MAEIVEGECVRENGSNVVGVIKRGALFRCGIGPKPDHFALREGGGKISSSVRTRENAPT